MTKDAQSEQDWEEIDRLQLKMEKLQAELPKQFPGDEREPTDAQFDAVKNNMLKVVHPFVIEQWKFVKRCKLEFADGVPIEQLDENIALTILTSLTLAIFLKSPLDPSQLMAVLRILPKAVKGVLLDLVEDARAGKFGECSLHKPPEDNKST